MLGNLSQGTSDGTRNEPGSAEEGAEKTCLQIEDAGGNSQAFLRLGVERGATYRLEVEGKRRAANCGEWFGCAAVSSNGGIGSQSTYLARSEFVGEPDRWQALSLEFTAPKDSVFVILSSQNAEGDVSWYRRLRIFRPRAAALRVLPPEDEPLTPVKTVNLVGSAEDIGSAWGRINAECIRHDLEAHYLKPARARGLAAEELVRRAGTFVDLARRLAAHWLPETEAVARAAGVDPELYLAYVGTVYRGLWAGEDCTSYAISPRFARDNGIFFHKNRDNQPKSQCAFLIDTDAPDVNRFISTATGRICSHGRGSACLPGRFRSP